MAGLEVLHEQALASFDRQVAHVGGHNLGDATPCAEWTVRELLNHVVGEDLWFAALLDGETLAGVGDRFDGDLLGSDPGAAWAAARQGALAAIRGPGALERGVELSRGLVPAADYVWEILFDHTIHAWDLARAVGGDATIEPALLDAATGWLEGHRDAVTGSGLFADPVELGSQASDQDRLLAALGRRP